MNLIPPESLAGQLATQAKFIVVNLQQTDYQHTDNIDPDRGIYDCDCSGFVSFVLERTAPDHYAMIPKEDTQPRPRAFKYYDFFAALTPESPDGWHRILRLEDARRGDIIAWRFPVILPHQDTGHVFYVAETPTVDASGTFLVSLYDSSAKPHFDDTRGSGPGEFATGIGAGAIKFHVDPLGHPSAFQFTPSDGFKSLPIAIGRVEPFPD